MRRLLATALAAAAAHGVTALPAGAQDLELTPVGRLPFPERGYVVNLPGRASVDPASVRVLENGRHVSRVDLSPVAAAGIHFGVVLAIDASESMTGDPLASAVDAARTFVARRPPDQEVGIVAFNGQVTLVQEPTNETGRLLAALASPPELAYGTRIYDAVDASLRLLARARLSSASIVLLSDGADIGSRSTVDQVIATARSRSVRVFAIGLRSGAFDSTVLRRIASETGGTYAEASSPRRLAAVFDALGRRLASEYVIRYRSDAAPRSRVTVRIDLGSIGGARAEYVAPTPAGLEPFHRSLFDRFLTSPGAPFVLSLLVALLAGVAVITFVTPRRSTLVERVGDFAGAGRRFADELTNLRPVARPRPTRGLFAKLDRKLEIARIGLSARRVVLLTGLATAVAVLGLALAAPVFGVLGLLTPLLARALIARKLRQVRDAFADQLAPNLQVLASALRIGHSFVGALRVVVENAHEPSQSELRRTLTDEQLGVPMEEAIRRVAVRMDSRDLEQVALLAELQRTAGGNAAEVLDTVVETLRERSDIRRLIRTLTAQGRLARWILSGLPVAAGLVLFLLQPTAIVPMLESGIGQAGLVVAALLIVTGSLVIQKLIEIKV